MLEPARRLDHDLETMLVGDIARIERHHLVRQPPFRPQPTAIAGRNPIGMVRPVADFDNAIGIDAFRHGKRIYGFADCGYDIGRAQKAFLETSSGGRCLAALLDEAGRQRRADFEMLICNHSGTPARRAMRRATGTAIIDGATVKTMSGLNSRRAARAGG